MKSPSILALSSSRVGNSAYLEPALPLIQNFLGDQPRRIAFVPFASVTNNYDIYLKKVQDGLAPLPHTIEVVTPANGIALLQQADAIMVGGGNTFHLLHQLYKHNLLSVIQQSVASGTPYIGWSAGANITGATIGTTNDMPIIEPESFEALRFFPFQINPHYINLPTDNHNGETRDERLTEYLQVNKGAKIVALPEGSALQYIYGNLQIMGSTDALLLQLDPTSEEMMKVPLHLGKNVNYLLVN